MKDLLYWFLVAGMVTIVVSSPYFVRDLLRIWQKHKQYKPKSVESAFHRLRKEGLIMVERKGHEYSVSLTNKGKKRTDLLKLDALEIARPKTWDQKWCLLMFDVKQTQRWKRDILRSFLRRLGFVQFQKSVWIHAYDCRKAVKLLQELLELSSSEVKLVTAADIGEDDASLRRKFRVDS